MEFIMQSNSQSQLFVELTAEESATVNGAYYYHNPYAFNPVYYDGYWAGYGAGYGTGYGYGQANSIVQTTNVNVIIED
jgi:hypothetical protein